MSDVSLIPRRGNLAEAVITTLSARIEAAIYAPGGKLPSEQDLCREFGVSRTVIREAVASLRLGGKLFSRQGLGVFVTEQDPKKLDFDIKASEDIRSALQILELRLGVEVEAVGLAASRRTPADIAEITGAFDRLAVEDGTDIAQEAKADFDFHVAIARATANPHFPQFLDALGSHITTDLLLKHSRITGAGHRAYLNKINREHGAILSAITQGDGKAARSAVRQHLEESMVRYRRLLSAGALQSSALPRREKPRPPRSPPSSAE